MKIFIYFKFKEGPWGGGNQFLKTLRKNFIKKNIYSSDFHSSDYILFNSNRPSILKDSFYLLLKKFIYRRKIIINRIDGPIYLRNGNVKIDKLITFFSKYFCDGVIYQSEWIRKEMRKVGMPLMDHECIILNSTSHPFVKKKYSKLSGKVKIIATSWSSNYKKGFDIYSYLDKNLDFSKYDFTFVGNSKIKFKNIKHIPPQDSIPLSKLLREHDIFITASRNDPCSNSLIEGLASGLPAIGLNSGGHPEIIKNGGLVFEGKKDVIDKIEKLVENYDFYKNNIDLDKMDEVSEKYLNFIKSVKRKKNFLVFDIFLYFIFFFKIFSGRLKKW